MANDARNPAPIDVGPVRIDPPVVLAPMEGITDRAFRRVIRGIGGVGLTVTEFVSSEGLTRDVQDAWRMAELDPDEHPVAIQIYGRDPERMAEAARHCEQLGADLVDINLGCPSKRVTSGCAGSALMREPDRAEQIFRAVFDAISVPMTVKMRLGWNDESINAAEIAQRAERAGAQLLSVHGRTREDGYKGSARWKRVAEVSRAVSLPVLVNGDIVDSATARDALAASEADGVMIGRGVMADPWALRRISASFGYCEFSEPTNDDRRRFLHSYLEHLGEIFELDRRTLAKLKRVCSYFTKGMYNAAKLRQALHSARTVGDARAVVDAYFEAITAGALDETYQLTKIVRSSTAA